MGEFACFPLAQLMLRSPAVCRLAFFLLAQLIAVVCGGECSTEAGWVHFCVTMHTILIRTTLLFPCAEGPIKPKEHLKKQRFPKLPQQEESAKDRRSRRDQELRERKMYLKNFWYAAALSEKVKDKPVGVDILGTRLTLFRDEEGKVVAVDDTCPHRGAPLSEGWTTTDKKSGKK